jgi:DHA1 family multidrug resistance protein-like MFS transporter
MSEISATSNEPSYVKRVGVFLGLIGLESFFANFAHPITPSLIIGLNLPASTFGFAFASMALLNFLFSPLWGRLSDRVGRLNLYLFSLFGYALGQILLMLARSQVGIYIARGTAGFFIGGVIVLQLAYLIDITPTEHRAKVMGFQTALFSITGALGFLAGGVIGEFSIQAVFITQAVGLISTGILTRLVLRDVAGFDAQVHWREVAQEANPFKAFRASVKVLNVRLALFFVMVFFGVFGFIAFDQSFNYYVRDQLGLGPSYNGLFKAGFGILGLALNSTVSIYLIRFTRLRKTLMALLALSAASAWAMILPVSALGLLGLSVAFFAFYSMVQVLTQALASKEVPKEAIGSFMGFFSSIRSLGMIFGSSLSGLVYAIHPLMAFGMTGLVMSLGLGAYALSLLQPSEQG